MDKDEYGLTGLSNYITKEKDRKKGEKRWNSSQNLKQPRIRKVHSKRPLASSGTYKPIGKYVDGFVRDAETIREQMLKWYPEYDFTDSGVYYNDFNGMFYIRARMRKRRNKDDTKAGKTTQSNRHEDSHDTGGRLNGSHGSDNGKRRAEKAGGSRTAATGNHKQDSDRRDRSKGTSVEQWNICL